MNILTINSGSSSIKFSLLGMGDREESILYGSAAGIGSRSGSISIRKGPEGQAAQNVIALPDHRTALREVLAQIRQKEYRQEVNAIGHRLVHGGNLYSKPSLVDGDLLAAVAGLVPFAPDHLPHEIDAIRECGRVFPQVRQVACFDTAFHRTMPAVAQQYALPDEVARHGVLRYGFHGLSYEYILGQLSAVAGADAANGRLVIAHLGNGASMGAFKNGTSMDTTMGFTPAGGLVMSTRSGDLDPGVIVYLLREKGMDAASLNRLVNKEAGLLGVSGRSCRCQGPACM